LQHQQAFNVQVLVPEVEDDSYDKRIEAFALRQLGAEEVRVRNAVAEALQALAHKHGACVWERCREPVCRSIQENYVRHFL
jgi:hypothetical protein